MSVSLAKPVDLTNTRAIAAGAMLAYATEELQAVKNLNEGINSYCTYVGPCAIGVSLTVEQRHNFDGGVDWGSVSIGGIIEDGRAIGDADALGELQSAHDEFAQLFDNEGCHLHFLIVTEFYARGLDQ